MMTGDVTRGEELPEVYYGAQEWSCIGEWRESEEGRKRRREGWRGKSKVRDLGERYV
jgi:hypothetical protein